MIYSTWQKNYSESTLMGSVFMASVQDRMSLNYSVADYYSDVNSDIDQGFMTIQNHNGSSYIYLYASKTKGCKLTPGNVVEPANAKEHLTVNPDKLSRWVDYHISSIPFIVYPHVMDRYYAARDVKTMKMALHLIHISLWISAIPAILIGLPVSVFVKGDTDMTNIENSNSVFATFLIYMIEQNDLMYIFGCLICSAAFAAYMSTADSGIMGFSSMISLDVLKYYVPPFNDRSDGEKQQRYLITAGKVLSCIGAFTALMLVTVYEDFPLGDLYVWQGSFLFQTFPAFILGMFVPGVCSHSVLIGCWVGFMIVVMMEQGANDTVLPTVFYSFLGNLGCIGAWELILRLTGNHPGFEPEVKPEFHGFGKMDKGFVGLDMSTVGGPEKEPFRPLWATFLVIFLVFIAIPYWASFDDYEITYVGGMPQWAVITFFLSACATAITMLQCHFYYDDWTEAITSQKDIAELASQNL